MPTERRVLAFDICQQETSVVFHFHLDLLTGRGPSTWSRLSFRWWKISPTPIGDAFLRAASNLQATSTKQDIVLEFHHSSASSYPRNELQHASALNYRSTHPSRSHVSSVTFGLFGVTTPRGRLWVQHGFSTSFPRCRMDLSRVHCRAESCQDQYQYIQLSILPS
jgi:hypothetical protein